MNQQQQNVAVCDGKHIEAVVEFGKLIGAMLASGRVSMLDCMAALEVQATILKTEVARQVSQVVAKHAAGPQIAVPDPATSQAVLKFNGEQRR